MSQVVVSLLLLAVFVTSCQAKFLRDLRWPGFRRDANQPQPSLTDILVLKDSDQDPIFEKAMQVVSTLATQSTCHQAAAAQVLLTCKAVGANLEKEDGKHEILDRAKSVYAIRVAVCETGEGKAPVPKTCQPILLIPSRLESEIDIVNSRDLANCLGELMEEHYYWTSYSNNRLDANTLCQATTLESTRLEALQSYQKLAELLPEFRESLGLTRSQWSSFLHQQQEDAKELKDLQSENRKESQAQHKLGVSSFRDAMAVARNGLLDVSQNLRKSLSSTDSDIADTREALRHLATDFTSLQDQLQDAISTTSDKTVEAAAAQARDMGNVRALAIAATKALEGIHADTVAQDMNSLVLHLQAQLNQITTAQSVQLANVKSHLELSEELAASQRSHIGLHEQIQGSAASLATELDSANLVAGRMSTRLDKVNQALTRVEAASTALSSLFAIITIPCQMAEHLHLRLLALFAMPAFVVSFWKPRKYPYSLMATYLFLESFISYFTEHKDNFSALLHHAIHQTQNIPHTALLYSAAILSVPGLLLCCHLLVTKPVRTRKRATTLTSKSIKKLESLTAKDRHYLEHKYGRRVHVDRGRRAATVC